MKSKTFTPSTAYSQYVKDQITGLLARKSMARSFTGQVILPFLLVLGFVTQGRGATINVPGDYATIQAAVNAAGVGDVIEVAPGTYNENVTINKSLTLRSSGGRAVTTIQGSTGLGTVIIQANNVTLGGIGQGFTIKGYDSPSPGLEYAAVYVQGARSNVTIRGNEIFADGEAGLLTEAGNAVTNFVVSANVFSGKTFVGAEAGDCGFTNQFTAFNVPRQLVVIQTGTGIAFTSNQITGTAGSSSSFSGCETTGQGNTLVTIDANNATIRGNTFAGTTTRFAHSLRVRGTGANISCNTFDNTGLGLACVHIFFSATALGALGTPNTLAGVASANTFVNEGAYFTGATQIYRSSAQVAAIPQTPIAANSTASPLVTNTNTGEIYCSIQAAIDDAQTLNGHIITVGPGTYAENININKRLTIDGAGSGSNPASNTIIQSAASGSPVITLTVGGSSATDRQVLKDVRITGAAGGTGNPNSGITVNGGGSYLTFDNVTATGNTGNGIAFNVAGTLNDLKVLGCDLSANGNAGLRLAPGSANFQGVEVKNTTFSNNGVHGLFHSGASTSTGFTIEDCTFTGNGANSFAQSGLGYGDLLLNNFNGNATIKNVSITGRSVSNAAMIGLQIRGVSPLAAAGTIALENVTITGAYRRPSLAATLPGAQGNALEFRSYTNADNVSFTGVNINNTDAGHGLVTFELSTVLNIGNTQFGVPTATAYGGVTARSILNGSGSSGRINAENATFAGLNKAVIADNYQIADRILDAVDDGAQGYVSFKANEVFVTPNSFNVPATTAPNVQRAVTAASTGNTVRIQPGTYIGNVNAATPAKDITLAPGASPGCVTINGNLTLNAGDVLDIEVDGTTSCTQHDKFIVNGTVNLGGASLNITLGYTPALGDVFTLIENDGTDDVIGSFAQGNSMIIGGNLYGITYYGGDGNDVVLTRCSGGVTNTNTGKEFCSIQDAIDDPTTLAGHTIAVAAGTYNESVYVYKNNITITGPNAGTAGNAARVPEAIIVPTEWYGIYVDGSGFTLDGITLDGNGVCDYGIYHYTATGAGGHTIKNNIVKNTTTYGFVGWVQSGAPSSNNLVTKNLFHHINSPTDGRAIVALWNFYANVTENVIHSTRIGIYAENANQPESTGTVEWKNNTITAYRAGIWYNLAYNNATPLTIKDNTISVANDPSGTRWDGMWLTSLGGSLNPIITNNTITGASVTQQTNGYNLWNNNTSATNGITINGGSVSNVGYGVWINNWEGFPTATGSNANSTKALIQNVSINNASTAGIYLHDNPLNTVVGSVVHATILNNFISNSPVGILVAGNDATATANNNSITATSSFAISSTSPTTINATCNWYGTAIFADIPAKVQGLVTNIPYLNSGTDSDVSTAGFQPAAGTCVNGPVSVYSDNTETTLLSTHATIQAGINAAVTGNLVRVGAGAYAENVTVNKSVTVKGPNADIACGSRVAEAIVAPASGVPFTVTADDVTINGFEITAPSSVYGINFGNTSNASIKFNNIHDIGTSVTNANVHAILYTLGSASKSNASITDNCLDNISSTGLTGWSASAIGILQSTSTGVLTGLNIERNTINDVQVNTGDWPTGKIAYGIIINVGGGSGYLTTSGEVVDAVIRNNEISNVSGFIATGIGLEGNTKNAVVENNSVAGLYGRKVGGTRAAGGFDLSALKIENNRWVGTLTIQNNSFQTNTFTHDMTAGLGYAVSNYVPAGTAFTGGGGGTTGEATISCNWLGSATYSQIQDNPTFTGKIFNKDNCVTNFAPYLINGNDDAPASIGFQPEAFSCIGGPVQVYNGNTLVSGHAQIQEAIDAATTLSGYIVRIASGTYVENVDAVSGGKSLIFAPGASPGCVTITGDLTLNAGDVLEIEIEGTTPCTEHDQFIVTGTVTLGGATITTPLGMYFAQPGDEIKIIDGSSPIAGAFAEGNFVTDGVNTYYINYAGGDGNDVVLTKCCGGLLDLGIFNYSALTPAGNKLRVFVKPNMDVINGAYSAGVFTIRTLTANGVTFTNLGTTPHAYAQVDEKTNGGYTYYFFSYVGIPVGPVDPSYFVNWNKNDEIPLLTLSYDCSKAGVVFELTNDAFTIANNGAYYQELGGASAQGVFYQATATSPAALSIIADNNGPLCNPMPIALSSTASNGTPAYTYAWSGPDMYSGIGNNPTPFASTLAKGGTYTVTVTDANGCTATATTNVVVLDNAGCVENVNLMTYYPTITQAINVPETLNGHTLKVPAGNWPENVNVTKALTINGANVGVACDGSRGAESVIMGTTAVTISSNGVTLDGFQIEGITGVSSAGYTAASIINNKFKVLSTGISSALVTTSATDGYVIRDNCVELADQTYDTQGFASNPTLAATQTPGAWYTDRYAPAGFVAETFGGSSRLKHSIDASACEGCRPSGLNGAFYNTQGRKYDIAGATAMSVDLYVPSDWATTGRRMAGLWGTAVDGSNAITRYPILEFASDGANPRFRVWDNGTWINLGLPTGFAYNQWYTLQIALLADGQIMCSVGDLSLAISGGGSTSFSNVILQGHNTPTPGVTYDIYWDNFNAYDAPVAQNAPTYGIALTAASGTQAVVLKDNNITNAFYGYGMGGVTTTPRTTVEGGTYTNLMQGVAVANTLDGINYIPSTVGVKNLSMTSFSGNHPAIPGANFHSGVYVFTGGANAAAVVDILVDNVVVSNTGKISPNSAGIHFADFSIGAGNRLNAVVQNSEISNNLNRGVQVRGVNATALVKNNEILFNGSDPYGLVGNDGFGVYAGVGAAVTLNNNTITNPAAQAGSYPVTAMFIGVAPAASITAFENSINRNGNGSLTGNTYPIAQFTATCNWWQSADIDVVDGLVDGNVLFVPYLIDGTDTDMGARGFVPTTGSCVNPTRWYVNDNALTDDVYTLGLGNDANQGTKRRPFRTIGKAVTTVQTTTSPVPGPNNNTIFVDAGMYNEQVVVPSTVGNLQIKGVGPCNTVSPAMTTMVDFTGTVSGKPTLFDIAGNGTVIDGIHFKVDLSKLNSAIIASHTALDDITIINNCIDPYHSIANTYFGSYSDRNAISINYGGTTNYRVASGGVDNILVDNNRVTATVVGPLLGGLPNDDIAFRSAVSVDEGAGTYTRNTFQSINHDILVRFNSNGPVVIGGSAANANTFLGGGVQYSDPNPGGGAVTISHNTFDGSVTGSVLRLQNNYTNAAVSVANNMLSNVSWGMSLENFRNVSVANNVLSPLAGFSNFRLITVNTKSISSNSATILQVPINGVFTGNTFNAGAPGTGIAMAFYNHDSDAASLLTGAFTVGTAGSPNVFAPGFQYAVYLGDQTGLTTDAPALALFPEYNLGSPGSTTIMACWDLDINIEKNTFDVGAGAQFPQFMNHAQRTALEAILWHLPDNPCLGELIYFVPTEIMAKVFLQGPFDSMSGLMNDNLRAANLLPADEPYTAINTANPGSFVEVNNFVAETGVLPAVFAVTGNNAIVDWIWLELRSKNDNTQVLATRSALVQRDGDVVDLDGVSPVLFPDSYVDEYYLMVRHRNHLGAMTATAVDFTSPVVVDFTTASQPTFGATATSARRLIKTATYGLWAGNALPRSGSDFQLIYNGSGADRLRILNVVGSGTPLNVVSGVYALEDLNMDGQVKYNGASNDRVIILNNVGTATPLNIITQQPNN